VQTHRFPKKQLRWHTLADLDTPEEALHTPLGITEKLLHPQADEW
jgi:hypothetical protein